MNIFTKFHKDWTTIVDFLLIAKFGPFYFFLDHPQGLYNTHIFLLEAKLQNCINILESLALFSMKKCYMRPGVYCCISMLYCAQRFRGDAQQARYFPGLYFNGFLDCICRWKARTVKALYKNIYEAYPSSHMKVFICKGSFVKIHSVKVNSSVTST